MSSGFPSPMKDSSWLCTLTFSMFARDAASGHVEPPHLVRGRGSPDPKCLLIFCKDAATVSCSSPAYADWYGLCQLWVREPCSALGLVCKSCTLLGASTATTCHCIAQWWRWCCWKDLCSAGGGSVRHGSPHTMPMGMGIGDPGWYMALQGGSDKPSEPAPLDKLGWLLQSQAGTRMFAEGISH